MHKWAAHNGPTFWSVGWVVGLLLMVGGVVWAYEASENNSGSAPAQPLRVPTESVCNWAPAPPRTLSQSSSAAPASGGSARMLLKPPAIEPPPSRCRP